MPDGPVPAPGGWNRIQLEVADMEGPVAELREADTLLRNDIVSGLGTKQILVEDPSGNVVELSSPIAEPVAQPRDECRPASGDSPTGRRTCAARS
jgi:hypothetical protein